MKMIKLTKLNVSCALWVVLGVAGCGDGGTQKMIDAAIDAPPPLTLECTTYCTQILAHCTGANAQYTDTAHCMAACSSFDGKTGGVADTTGNTLGCRIHYAAEAASQSLTANDCAFAGPAGELVNENQPAHCSGGDVCASYCTLEIQACGSLDQPLPGDPKEASGNPLFQYLNQDNCVQNCASLNKVHPYNTASAGDSFACRLRQSVEAAIAPVPNGQAACQSTGPDPSAPCAGAATP